MRGRYSRENMVHLKHLGAWLTAKRMCKRPSTCVLLHLVSQSAAATDRSEGRRGTRGVRQVAHRLRTMHTIHRGLHGGHAMFDQAQRGL